MACARQRVPVCPAPDKIFGQGVSLELPCWTALLSSQLAAGGIKHILSDSAKGQRLEACTWFPLDFALCIFPLCWFPIYPSAIINISRESHYVLSPVSPSSDSQSLQHPSTQASSSKVHCQGSKTGWGLRCPGPRWRCDNS